MSWRARGAQTVVAASRQTFAVLVAGVALVLMIPAIVNGSPFIFFDSDQYFAVGQRIFETIAGARQESAELAPVEAATLTPDPADGGLAAVAGGRSPVYSIALYLVTTFLTQWTMALVQALVCAVLIVRFCQLAWGRLDRKAIMLIALALSLLSGLGFHAAFMMPDVFAGCLVLTLAIFLYFRPAGRMENLLLVGGTFAMATLHTTNLLLVISALVAALIVQAADRKPRPSLLPRLTTIAGIVAATLAFNAAYAAGVRAIAGEDVRSPPYLMARVLGDGAGEAYLAKHCTGPDTPFAACAYAGIDFKDSDAFLWDPTTGGLQKAGPELRAALSAEEMRFVAAVVASDPVAQIGASLGNFARQLVTAGVDEINFGVSHLATTPPWRESEIMRVTPGAAACKQVNGCAPPPFGPAWSLIVGSVNLLLLPFFVAAMLALFGHWKAAHLKAPEAAANLIRAGWFIALLVLANAAICGILSGVNGRYETRMVWTLALAMMALATLLLPNFQRTRAAALPTTGSAD